MLNFVRAIYVSLVYMFSKPELTEYLKSPAQNTVKVLKI